VGSVTDNAQQSVRVDANYVVLQQMIEQSQLIDAWKKVATIAARNADAAIEKALEKRLIAKEHGAVFIAVASRSWKPKKAREKVETSIVIEDAS
jgi:hypothetical protein